MKTGYGQQTGLFTKAISELGHDVTISTYGGLQGREIDWNGIRVMGGSREAHGNDFLGVRAGEWLADGPGFLIILGDTWCFNPRALKGGPVAMWTPVDCDPLGAGDHAVLAGAEAVPIATSRHGAKMMTGAGLTPLLVPHGIDTDVFRPGDKAEARRILGFPQDAFIVGMNGANSDSTPSRKAFPQQLQAFARFRKTHPDAVMALHTRIDGPDGAIHMHELSERLGITGSLFYSDQRRYWEGAFTAEYLATFYNAIDVLSATSFGEGFGLPLLEAQSCGVPVITSDHSAMKEMCGAGWLVDGDPWWQNDHLAFWHAPRIDAIKRAYVKAHDLAGRKKAEAREFALGFDVKRITQEYWVPVLATLEARLAGELG
jgi:glycosyltransferase involved in cell wall biosynthesis